MFKWLSFLHLRMYVRIELPLLSRYGNTVELPKFWSDVFSVPKVPNVAQRNLHAYMPILLCCACLRLVAVQCMFYCDTQLLESASFLQELVEWKNMKIEESKEREFVLVFVLEVSHSPWRSSNSISSVCAFGWNARYRLYEPHEYQFWSVRDKHPML